MNEMIFRYEVIYQDILTKIQDGTYPPGTRLMSEKELSEKYQVSRITSKRALNMLADQKLISRTPGRGSYVLEMEAYSEKKAQSPVTQVTTAEKVISELEHRQRKLIGVILDNFSSGFGEILLKSLEHSSRMYGYGMLLRCTYENAQEEEKAIRELVEMGVEGLIIICVQNETYSKTLLKMALEQFPVVLVDRKMKGISIPCITTDNFRGARELTELLIQRGHKKLCFLTHTSLGTSTIQERHDGFVSGIMDYSDVVGRVAKVTGYQPTMQQTIETKPGYEITEFQKIVQDNSECTGFLALESKLAEALCQAIEQEKTSKEVVCFDQLKSGSCGIAYLKQDEKEMGKVAVETLDAMIHGKTVEEEHYIPYEIVMI